MSSVLSKKKLLKVVSNRADDMSMSMTNTDRLRSERIRDRKVNPYKTNEPTELEVTLDMAMANLARAGMQLSVAYNPLPLLKAVEHHTER